MQIISPCHLPQGLLYWSLIVFWYRGSAIEDITLRSAEWQKINVHIVCVLTKSVIVYAMMLMTYANNIYKTMQNCSV